MKPIWIYGVQSARALLAARPEAVEELVVAAGARGAREELWRRAAEVGVRRREARPRELDALCGVDSHQGVAVRAPLPPYVELEKLGARAPHLLLALDGITDPQNLGAIVRSAEALGASGALWPADRSAGLSPAAHKASAGALEWLPVARVVNLARALRELKDAGFWIYGADPAGDRSSREIEFAPKRVLVIGSEGKGIRPVVEREVDFRVRIELAGRTESLNASVAGAIMLFQATAGSAEALPGK
jgi:23S rRNA (guanosine2251-2'-O)-methyltransferase